jgi:hypothetical protein
MKKLIFALTLFLATSVAVKAQDYSTGIGVRGGLSSGLTVKHFIGSNKAIEGLLSSRWRGFHITGLYEIHARAFDTPRLNWYYGVGGHVGFWDDYDRHPWFDDDGAHTVVGVDGIIGIEYNIVDIPFNISLDWKPSIDIIGDFYPWADEVALSIRYIF